jgi:hypothetical protein
MMKRILSLILVLAIGSVASAASVWLEVDDSDAATSYAGSSIITINVVSDVDVTGIGQLSIGSTGGTASTPLYMDARLSALRNLGTIYNSAGILILGISGGTYTALPPVTVAAGDIIYSFEYHVPEIPDSTFLSIAAWEGDNPDGIPYPLSTSITTWEDTGGEGTFGELTDVGTLDLHIPEPTTIALLGIGALSLLRRRRKTA